MLDPLISSAMSTFNPAEKNSESGSGDFVRQIVLDADHSVTIEKSDVEVQVDPDFERKTLRKVDLYVLPILAVLFSVSIVDRINIA